MTTERAEVARITGLSLDAEVGPYGGTIKVKSDQRRHESPEVGAMIGRMLNALVRRAAEGDWEALEALAEIERLAPAAMTAGLTVARQTYGPGGKPTPGPGYSLGELAKVVGVTRSAISQRTAPQQHKGTPRDCGHALCVGMRRCRTTQPTT